MPNSAYITATSVSPTGASDIQEMWCACPATNIGANPHRNAKSNRSPIDKARRGAGNPQPLEQFKRASGFSSIMDITSFVVRGREQALLYGDYSTYHGQLARRLLSSRKKLGIVTKNRGKFQKKAQATVEDVGNNNE